MVTIVPEACMFCGATPAQPYRSDLAFYEGCVFCGPECLKSQIEFDHAEGSNPSEDCTDSGAEDDNG